MIVNIDFYTTSISTAAYPFSSAWSLSPRLICPIPSGVPVKIKSPRLSKNTFDKNSISSSTGLIKSLVLPLWRNSPLSSSSKSKFGISPVKLSTETNSEVGADE